jgi:hypothetical protein
MMIEGFRHMEDRASLYPGGPKTALLMAMASAGK